MTNGIDWSTVLANFGTFLVALASLVGLFWGLIKRTTRSLIAEDAVSSKVYREEQTQIKSDIEQLKKSDAEFRVMQSQIQNVQRSVESLKVDLKDNAEQQRAELNGGLSRLSEDMRQYAKAVAGK